MIPLDRWLATWNDNQARVIHAKTNSDAFWLARQLQVPAGVSLIRVEPLPKADCELQ